MKTKKCHAYAVSTKARCTKSVRFGSKYCWHHQSKLPIAVAFLIGIITSVFLPKIWEHYFPPEKIKEIEMSTAYIPDMAKDLKTIIKNVYSSNIKVKLKISVNKQTQKRFNGIIFGVSEEVVLITKSGKQLSYKSNIGTTYLTRTDFNYTYVFDSKLIPNQGKMSYSENEFLGAQKIKIPLKRFVKSIKKDLKESDIECTLNEISINYFINKCLAVKKENYLNEPIDEEKEITFSIGS